MAAPPQLSAGHSRDSGHGGPLRQPGRQRRAGAVPGAERGHPVGAAQGHAGGAVRRAPEVARRPGDSRAYRRDLLPASGGGQQQGPGGRRLPPDPHGPDHPAPHGKRAGADRGGARRQHGHHAGQPGPDARRHPGAAARGQPALHQPVPHLERPADRRPRHAPDLPPVQAHPRAGGGALPGGQGPGPGRVLPAGIGHLQGRGGGAGPDLQRHGRGAGHHRGDAARPGGRRGPRAAHPPSPTSGATWRASGTAW